MSALIDHDLLLLILAMWAVMLFCGTAAAVGWKLGLSIWPHVQPHIGLRGHDMYGGHRCFLRTFFIGRQSIIRLQRAPEGQRILGRRWR